MDIDYMDGVSNVFKNPYGYQAFLCLYIICSTKISLLIQSTFQPVMSRISLQMCITVASILVLIFSSSASLVVTMCVYFTVVIVDPAISNQATSYMPYEDGVNMEIFIKVMASW